VRKTERERHRKRERASEIEREENGLGRQCLSNNAAAAAKPRLSQPRGLVWSFPPSNRCCYFVVGGVVGGVADGREEWIINARSRKWWFTHRLGSPPVAWSPSALSRFQD